MVALFVRLGMMRVKLPKNLKTPFLVFLFVFLVFLSNLPADFARDLKNRRYRRMMVSGDIVPSSFLPWLMTYKGTVSFDSIMETIRQFDGRKDLPYFLIETDKGFRTAYPILPSIMGIPFYLLPSILNKIPEVTYHENILKVFLLGRVTASFYAALSVVLFYYILREVSKKGNLIIIFTLFYAFGTNVWSVSSRGMWQHTFSTLFISIGLLLLLKAMKKPRLIPWVGFVLGLSVLVRPTNVILAAAVSLYVWFCHRKQIFRYILYALPTVIFLGMYNILTYGAIFTGGYAARGYGIMDLQHWSTPLGEGLVGFLFSPARSFLFLSPPLVLSYVAIFLIIKARKFGGKNNLLYKYLSVGTVLTVLLMSKWVTWHGANAFGYRMLLGVLPIFALLAFEYFRNLSKKGRLVVIVLIFYSVFVHANATYFRKSRCSEDHNWSFYCLELPKEKSKY